MWDGMDITAAPSGGYAGERYQAGVFPGAKWDATAKITASLTLIGDVWDNATAGSVTFYCGVI